MTFKPLPKPSEQINSFEFILNTINIERIEKYIEISSYISMNAFFGWIMTIQPKDDLQWFPHDVIIIKIIMGIFIIFWHIRIISLFKELYRLKQKYNKLVVQEIMDK
ncbi:MAG TPA: hypothetical protein VIE65_07355 [Methylobacter sp.]|jgi:hypothetical protein